MPPVSDVRPTSHDRHDPMLVAALAAGDLAGTDRDQAIALTRSCADCATLHDDLLALARATAATPAPFATPRRDFRLTPADAARLRPTGWRRLVATLAAPRSAVTRPLGVGLATLGLVGLLVGNVQLGGTTTLPDAARTTSGDLGAAPAASNVRDATGVGSAAGPSLSVPAAQFQESGPAAVASAAPAQGAASVAPAQAAASGLYGAAVSTGAPGGGLGQVAPIASDGKTALDPAAGPESGALAGSPAAGGPVPSEPFRPLNVLFGSAVVVGLGLLVAGRQRGRRPA